MSRTIGVVGAGVMGHGIAAVFASSGYNVILSDVQDSFLSAAIDKMKWSLENLYKKGTLKEKAEDIIARVRTTTDLNEFASADYIVEVVKEDSTAKRNVLEKLDSIAGPECIFASNTSTIPITELASMTRRADRFIGLHFSNPPIMMPIVEIILASNTSEKTLSTTEDLVKSIHKEYVTVRKDVPGFLINRLNDRVILESMKMLEAGSDMGNIDAMFRFRLGFPMGICELLDFVGIDTVYNANREMRSRGFSTEESTVLKQKVEVGELGMKSGRGFYPYPKPNVYARPVLLPNEGMFSISPIRLLSSAINEAAWIVRNGVASKEDVDRSMKMAMNWPEGPLEMADRFGLDNVAAMLDKQFKETGSERYRVDPLIQEMLDKGKTGIRKGEGFLAWNADSRNFGPVSYISVDCFAIITLNRPDRLNALNEETWEGIRKALEEALAQERVRSVILTGSGRAFSAGDDIDMMEKWKSSMDAKIWMNTLAQPLLDVISRYPKPIISAVNGIAFGGGCELNMMFDIVIADNTAMFSLPEGLIGAMPPLGSSYGIALISRKLARYALTGDWFSAAEALKLGMVDVVVSGDQLMAVATEYAKKIAKVAPLSVAGIKSSINAVRQTFAGHAKSATDDLLILASSEDFHHGQESFMKKKKPLWRGR
jgi:3-hydroxyacyl-CoA dehydrogenase